MTELATLNRIGLSLNGSLDLGDVLGEILDSALELVPAQAAAVALADPALAAASIASLDRPARRRRRGAAGRRRPGPRASEPAPQVVLGGAGTDRRAWPRPASGAWSRCRCASTARSAASSLVTFAAAHDVGADERLLLSTLAEQAATAVHNARLYQEIEAGLPVAPSRRWCRSSTRASATQQGHSERIRAYCGRGRPPRSASTTRQLATLELAALFHDLGHVGVPEAVLSKPGAADGRGVGAGAHATRCWASRSCKQVPRMEAVVPVILQHHERYDGQGYPAGLLGDDTSRAGPGPGRRRRLRGDDLGPPAPPGPDPRRRRSPSCARHSGTQFAPRVVDAFVQATETSPAALPDARVDAAQAALAADPPDRVGRLPRVAAP